MAKRQWWDWTWGKAVWITLAGVASGLVFATLESRGYSYGGPSTSTVNRDPKKLLPGFAWRLELLFRRMRQRGFTPVLQEGWRSPARALQLQAQGVPDHLHAYGAAATIFSEGLNDSAFFTVLGEEADMLGLTWGGRLQGEDHDPTQIQAIPNFLGKELMALETAGAREAFIQEYYAV